MLLAPVAMLAIQTVLLRRHGLPFTWRISGRDLPRDVKRVNRIMTYVAFGGLIAVYPLLRGELPWSYYAPFLPANAHTLHALHGAALSVAYLAFVYAIWTATRQVELECRDSTPTIARKLGAAPLTALLAAFVEELLFRAVLLADLLETFGPVTAIVLGAVIFAAAHYIRSVKRYWTFPGHVVLGLLFCVAFYQTGTLWLPVGLHAGGILVLMAVRPFVRYTGPPWLVGASIFPYAGVMGITALLLLIANVWWWYGAALCR